MKKLALSLAAIAAMSAAPAYAEGEGRVEIQGGIAFSGGTSEAFAGVGGGYDFDLGDKAFVGLDLGVGKVLARGTDVFGYIGGRVGVRTGENVRIYASGGVGFCCGGSDPYIGLAISTNLATESMARLNIEESCPLSGRTSILPELV